MIHVIKVKKEMSTVVYLHEFLSDNNHEHRPQNYKYFCFEFLRWIAIACERWLSELLFLFNCCTLFLALLKIGQIFAKLHHCGIKCNKRRMTQHFSHCKTIVWFFYEIRFYLLIVIFAKSCTSIPLFLRVI